MWRDVRLQHLQGFQEPLSGLAGGHGPEPELAGHEGRGSRSVGDGGTGVDGDGDAEGLEGAAEKDAGAGTGEL